MKYLNINRKLILSIFSIFLIGLIHIPSPLFGDQAFFLLGAKEMNEGLVLYQDFWDIKQPGIFIFYLAAGKAFGFTAIGIHIFELCYWLCFSILLVWFLRKFNYFKYDILTYLAPLMIVGTYYSNSSVQSLTQVEALVSFPILLVLIFNKLYIESNKRKMLWLFLSGVAGGLVVFFKFIFAPILIAFWIGILISNIRNHVSYTKIAVNILIISAGVITFWIPFGLYCYHHNIVQLCYYTFIKLPPLVLEYGKIKSFHHLFNSIYYFFSKISFLLILSFISIIYIRKKPILINLWLWLVLGIIVILLQKNSWYTYHFQLLYLPVVLLALYTSDRIIEKLQLFKFLIKLKLNFIIAFFLLLINGFTFFILSGKINKLHQYNYAISAGNRIAYWNSNIDNERAYRVSQYLNSLDQKRCSIFVVNDPLIYYYTQRNQATAQSGWSMQLFVPGQLEILFKELVNTVPCYIFIRREFLPYFETRGIEIYSWMKKNYIISNSSSDGIWYKSNSNL